VTLEANLRVQWKINVTLSINHLKKLYEDSKISMPNVNGKIKRLLSMLKNEGVFEEDQYKEIMKVRLEV
jgi:ABC-type metal ion transport system substrate-binding protein